MLFIYKLLFNFKLLSTTKLRYILRNKRQRISKPKQQKASQLIAHKILQLEQFKLAQNIAIYIPSEGEIDPTWLQKLTQDRNKNFYLPVVEKKQLTFVLYQPGDKLHTTKWHIQEPQNISRKKCIASNKIDLAILPLVAFDTHNNRLGRGKGYYDRTFAQKISTPQTKPYLLGVAYSWQKIFNLHPKSWDIKMDKVIEIGLIESQKFSSQS